MSAGPESSQPVGAPVAGQVSTDVAVPVDVQARAAELRTQLEHHAHRYYVLDDPEIGDDAYDALLDELRSDRGRAPAVAHTGLAHPAGRRRAGGQAGEGHAPGADALAAATLATEEELRAWVERMRTHLAREGIADPRFRFVVEPKIDGLAISLVYRDGSAGARRDAGQR